MHADHVRPGQQLVEVHQLHAQPACHLGRDVRVAGHHAHAEPLGALRHHAADVAEPDQTERAVQQLETREAALLPAARLHRGGGLGDVARQRDEQRDGVLGGGDVVALGRVHHHDAARGGARHVDVVDADPRAPDHAQLLGGVDHLGGHLGAAADHQAVGVADRLEQLVGSQARPVVDLEAGRPLEDLEALGGELVADEDLGHGSPRSTRGRRLRARHVRTDSCGAPGAPVDGS